MSICIIPARGGSKRVPRKNVKPFHGKPMIQWSIEAAQNSGVFQEIIVSTDDGEIAKVASSLGALVPFMRPLELSDDYSSTIDVMAHATQWASRNQYPTQIVCCLYATAPFVASEDLIQANKIIKSGKWQYVFSVGEHQPKIFRSFRRAQNGGVEMFFPDYFDTRSQELPTALYDAGMFYMARGEAWLSGSKIFEDHSFPMIIPSWRVCDIDTPDDWKIAVKMAPQILGT